jgi:starch synthase
MMKILFVSSEVVPFAKTGGLGDVAGALPKALKELGHDIRVFMPRYKSISPRKLGLKKIADEIYEGKIPASDVTIYFFENKDYFGGRDGLYQENGQDYKDNLERFTAFCQGALKFIKQIKWQPDIIHCNDWQTGLIPAYLKLRHDPFFSKTAAIYSIHNLGYLGVFPKEKLPLTGLGWEQFTPEKLEFWGSISLAKAGLVYADKISTVSKKYAEEIQTEEFGHGLHGLIRLRNQHVTGIVNGLDYKIWDPQFDPNIPKRYSADSIGDKKINKRQLQAEYNLVQNEHIPVVGMISRLADQKGLDILGEALEGIMQLDCQLIVLGTGDPKYHRLLEKAKMKYPQHLGLHLKFDGALAQLIYAGSDMFLMPSRYEPCGLGQLISFKYGTVPIVRETGGLADTVDDFNAQTGWGSGFTFKNYNAKDLLAAIKRGVRAFKNIDTWETLQQRIMGYDYSWAVSAKAYESLAREAIELRA